MIGPETSDVTRGNFLNMEEGVAGQNHLKTWLGKVFRVIFILLEHRRMERRRVVQVRCPGGGEVCQGAHMKSFSLFYRCVCVVLGSLDERRCSRVSVTGERLMFI